jgi:cytochrome b involved in lipid metabolism
MPFLIDNLDINNDCVVFSDRILKVLPSSFQTDLNIIDCIVNSSTIISISNSSATITTSCMTSSYDDKNLHDNENNKNMSFTDVTNAMQADKNLNLIIYKQRVYSIKLWLPKHPGGDLVITHMIGEDATNQILAFHSNIKQVERIMEKYFYANLIDDDDSNNADDKADSRNHDSNNYVDYNNDKCSNDEEGVVVNKMQKQQLSGQQQQHENDRLVKSFDSLKDTVSRLGLMETSYLFYYIRGFQYLLQFIGSIFICFYAASYFNSIIGGISIGMVS